MSTSSLNRNKTVLMVILAVLAVPIFSCCVCAPMVAILAPSNAGEADRLWQEGKKAEAAEIYAADLDKGHHYWDAEAMQRVVTYYHDQGEMEKAKHYCRVAVDSDQDLVFASDDVRKLYEKEKAAYERELAKPTGFAARVRPASRRQLEAIAAGLEKDFLIHPSGAYTVKASSHDDAYYVVAPMTGPGISDRLGAWLRYGNPEGDGMVLSANGMAAEFSVFPEGFKTKANAWQDDEDCDKLLDYVSQKTKSNR